MSTQHQNSIGSPLKSKGWAFFNEYAIYGTFAIHKSLYELTPHAKCVGVSFYKI